MTTKEEIIDGLRMVIREGLRTTQEFGPDDWSQVVHDDEGGWTRKQVYCHLVATAEVTPGFLSTLANAPEGQDVGAGLDLGAFNAQQVSAREELSTEELMRTFDTSFQQIIETVQSMPEEQMELRRRFGALEGTLGDMMASILVLHSISHIYLSSTRAFV